jgi:hypothetical protein
MVNLLLISWALVGPRRRTHLYGDLQTLLFRLVLRLSIIHIHFDAYGQSSSQQSHSLVLQRLDILLELLLQAINLSLYRPCHCLQCQTVITSPHAQLRP